MSKSKVLIVGKLPPPYIGPAIATHILLNSKLQERYDLCHLNTTVNQSVEEFGKGGVLKILRNLKIYINLIKLLRKEQPNLVLLPISQTTLGFAKDAILIWIAWFFSRKILLQLRGSDFKNWMKRANVFTRFWVKLSLKRAEGIIVLGNNLKHLFEGVFKTEQIFVVPNGCDLTFPESRVNEEGIQVLYFANLLPSKGIWESIQAVKILHENKLDLFKLEVVGAWDNKQYRKKCLNFVQEHNLKVNFHQPLTGIEKRQIFADADVFLFPPNKPEGHPWVIVEALAAGLPIISSDQGAIIESVLHMENGFIVDPHNAAEIAEALQKLIENESLRKAFSEKSRAHYLNNFTEQRMIEELTNAIQRILN